MIENTDRKLFLNVRATLEGSPMISNIEIDANEKFYSLSCDLCMGNRLAFGIRKQSNVAFIKGTIRVTGMDDESINKMFTQFLEPTPLIKYTININKVAFQEVVPLKGGSFEKNNESLFHELYVFVEMMSTACRKLGMGDTILLNYMDYVKPNNSLPKPDPSVNEDSDKSSSKDNGIDKVIHIMPDSGVPKENIVRAEIEQEKKFMKESGIDSIDGNIVDTNDSTGNSVIDLSELAGEEGLNMEIPDYSDNHSVSVNDLMDDIEEEDLFKKNNFSGSVPVDMMDDLGSDYGDDDYIGGIIKDDELTETDAEPKGEDAVLHTQKETFSEDPSISKEPERQESKIQESKIQEQISTEDRGIVNSNSSKVESNTRKLTDIVSEADEIGDFIGEAYSGGSSVPKNKDRRGTFAPKSSQVERQKRADELNAAEERFKRNIKAENDKISVQEDKNKKDREEQDVPFWKKKQGVKGDKIHDLQGNVTEDKKDYKKGSNALGKQENTSAGGQKDDKKQTERDDALSRKRNERKEENRRRQEAADPVSQEKEGDNLPMGENRGNQERRGRNVGDQKENIFFNYERDLKNIEGKYRSQIRNLTADELIDMIESRYSPYSDSGSSSVPDYIRERLCNAAKEELKIRLVRK